jgi:MFS superfamily sulfate permease-like transporter
MKIKPKNIAILTLLCTSFVVAMFDISAGIFLAVFCNTIINYILFSRQKSKTTKVRKSRAVTVDEFRQKEMKANPHRPYPHADEFTD